MLEDEQIFVGGAPSNADEYFTRFCLQMGTTVNAFIRRKEKRKGPLASKAGPRGMFLWHYQLGTLSFTL